MPSEHCGYGTKYASPRGGLIKCEVLLDDMDKYYADNGGVHLSRQQLYDTLRGIRVHTDEICRIAFFLRISIEDILHTSLSADIGPQAFDRKVLEMRKQNIPYKQIAKELNASLDLVKPIGSGRYRTYSQASGLEPKKRKKIDWEQKDNQYCHIIRKEVLNRLNCGSSRPRRICRGSICRALGIRREHLMHMKACLKFVDEHSETWEQFWEREIHWAVKELEQDGRTVNITNIGILTGIKKNNLVKIWNQP